MACASVYLRKTFTVSDPAELESLVLSVDVDDGFVAYINGHEAARFNAPGKPGEVVKFDVTTPAIHEAGEPVTANLVGVRHRLVAGKNVLAIQVINRSKSSSDLTAAAKLIDRETLPGSVENGDPNGVWAFHFFAELHNAADTKKLFKGTPYELDVPAGRKGPKGLSEAEDAMNRILEHPSTAIFICSKLIQRFVGDEIDFRKPKEGDLAPLLERCVEAWNSTEPKGNIRTVVKTILSSPEFWSESAYRAKVKDPFEYVTSTLRALDARSSGLGVPKSLAEMGMEMFTRDDPDGWPELGGEWVDTGSFQTRMAFSQELTETAPLGEDGPSWDAADFFEQHDLETADDIVNFFEMVLFQREWRPVDRELIEKFLTTDAADRPVPLDPDRSDYFDRERSLEANTSQQAGNASIHPAAAGHDENVVPLYGEN